MGEAMPLSLVCTEPAPPKGKPKPPMKTVILPKNLEAGPGCLDILSIDFQKMNSYNLKQRWKREAQTATREFHPF
jgi:hypothetical protein